MVRFSRNEPSHLCGSVVPFSRVLLRAISLALAIQLCVYAADAQQARRPHSGKGAMSAQEISTLPQAAVPEGIPADSVCARYPSGSIVQTPTELRSSHGVLEVTFKFKTTVDWNGITRYCFVTGSDVESPTLRVNPGDKLIIHFQNQLPGGGPPSFNDNMAGMQMDPSFKDNTGINPCHGVMNPNVANLHFHGTNTAPVCGQDNVTAVLIQPGQNFDYNLQIPLNEPPGLYWYHTHAHGYADMQVGGGASGALIVEGLQTVDPSLKGLPERTLVLRDQNLPAAEMNDPNIPAWDLSINYVQVKYPDYTPAVIQTVPGRKELWRVANNSADTIMDLQYVVNKTPRPLRVVAIDGVPIAAGPSGQSSTTETSILLAPASRAEFVVTTPAVGDKAQLVTKYWDTGEDGDFDPDRPIANVVSLPTPNDAAVEEASAEEAAPAVAPLRSMRFASLAATAPVAQRTLYFSEVLQDPNDPAGPTNFFITEEGEQPQLFQPGQPPSIVVHSGTVEDWVIENRALEDHVFHIHQIHFQVTEANGQPVWDPALRDTVDVPFWDGKSPYPSVKLHMDFRDPNIVGDFVYHCHILAHEDGGMMAVIRVLPPGVATTTTANTSITRISPGQPIHLNATVAETVNTGGRPVGNVQFELDGNNVGNPVWLVAGQAALTTVINGPPGHRRLTAFYEGGPTHAESVSSVIEVKVLNFGLASSGASATAGATAHAPVNVKLAEGFTGPVSLTCAVPGTMTKAACSLSPDPVTNGGYTYLKVTSGSAAKGTYQVVVTGSGGGDTNSVAIPITLN